MQRYSVLAVSVAVAGCINDGQSAPTTSSDGGVEHYEAVVRDHLGRQRCLDAIPRRPLLSVVPSPRSGTEPAPLLLLHGPPDPVLLADLRTATLPTRVTRRAIPSDVFRVGGETVLRPVEPLPPAVPVTLALGGWAEIVGGTSPEKPWLFSLRTGSGPDAGATLTDTWPAEGAAGVSTHLSVAALRFDGELATDTAEHVRLEATEDPMTPAVAKLSNCVEIGWDPGHCVVWELGEPLRGTSDYRFFVSPDATDVTGAPLGPREIRFSTAAAHLEDRPPEFTPMTCGRDEQTLDVGCALVDDRSITLRVVAGEPVRLAWATPAGAARAVAPRGEATLTVEDLTPATVLDGTLTLTDFAGQTTTAAVSLETLPSLDDLTIVEVSSNPEGPEPAQEYVELLSFDAVPIDLRGYQLSDRADAEGDVLENSRTVTPGSRLLLVADGFDPAIAPVVPPGVPVLRLGSSLASGGLRNAGEPLYLRDSQGRRVATVPPFDVDEGECIQRRDETRVRARSPEAFVVTECSPGLPPP